ncbi:Uridine nucleosidase 1 [Extremus antarcticus]|uniref:Uridine nucleosidase 1 n=1 Tax=Extremus antarcticus TaxID=702011 RepID=A0AAJ0GAZ4_9PEZI|nr:Uridine nucleosidase 1 [Extremus antarcticus]
MPDQDDRTPIWLDVDTGHDDAFAILLAAHHPKIQLLGISTVYGNASLTKTTYNTRAILKAIGKEDVPVYAGTAKPFCREAAHAPDIHGESGLDGTTCLPTPTVPVRTNKTALEAMYEALIATPKGTAWVVPTGALTNAGLLFATHPDLVSHVAGVSAMGGAIGSGFTDAPMGTVVGEGERFGNITPYAEFNVYVDPESAKSIISNKALAAKTTLVTLDLTHRFLATGEVQKGMLHGFDSSADSNGKEPSQVRKLFIEILTFFAKTYADIFGITDGPPVHDPLAVVAAFAPALFSDEGGERYEVDVVTDGAHGAQAVAMKSQCGRTIATPVLPGEGGVRIPKRLDDEAVWRMLDECLRAAEKFNG